MDFEVLATRYTYWISWSREDKLFVGRVKEWPSLAAHGVSAESARNEIIKLVAIVIADCIEGGDEYPKPLSQW